jgi:hypothetical protein
VSTIESISDCFFLFSKSEKKKLTVGVWNSSICIFPSSIAPCMWTNTLHAYPADLLLVNIDMGGVFHYPFPRFSNSIHEVVASEPCVLQIAP